MLHKPPVIVVLLVVALLAGCTEKTPDASDEEPNIPPGTNGDGGRADGNGSQPPLPMDLWQPAEFVDCEGLVSAYHVDPATVDMKLPEGYSSTGFLGLGPDANINLEYYHCKAIILDNTTVLYNVSQAMFLAFVDPPEGTESPRAVDLFLFEWLTDSAEFLDYAGGFGAPIQMGAIDVEISDTTDGEASVVVDGEAWYQSVTAADGGDAFQDMAGARKLHYMDEGGPAWVLSNETANWHENLLRAVATDATGGAVSEFPWAATGQLVGYGQYLRLSGFYDFGRLEEST